MTLSNLKFKFVTAPPVTPENNTVYLVRSPAGGDFRFMVKGPEGVAIETTVSKQEFLALNKTSVGLGNVDNTSDAEKPVSTATQTALNAKENSLGFTPIQQGGVTGQGTNKVYVGWAADASGLMAQVDDTNFGTSWPINISKNADTATKLATPRAINDVNFDGTANITVVDATKEPAFAAGTAAQYRRGDKTWQTLNKSAVGLGSVDNTADASKPVSTAQQTALNLKASIASPALTGVPTAPTAANGTSTTQLATTAFVQGAVGGYLSKSATGGTLVLTSTEASNPVIGINGALTSNLFLEIPVTSKRIYSVYNTTTGAFTVTVKHTGLTPSVLVAQGKRNIVYSNGIGVYDAITSFDAIALTGASTAATAAAGTNTTQIATTAFVMAALSGGNVVHVTTASATAAPKDICSLDFAGVTTLSLPLTPSEGTLVTVVVGNGRLDNLINPNGKTIMSVAGAMTIDKIDFPIQFLFINNTWKIL